MELINLINLKRQGKFIEFIDYFKSIDNKHHEYIEICLELNDLYFTLFEYDKISAIFDRIEDLVLDRENPSHLFYWFSQRKRLEINILEKNLIDYSEELTKYEDIIDFDSLSNIDKRYLGFSLMNKYFYETKSLSSERDEINNTLDSLSKGNQYFIVEEFKHINYRDRWYKREFQGIIDDFTDLRDNMLEQNYYFLASKYQNLIHLAHRPIAKGSPKITDQILDLMKQNYDIIEKIEPNEFLFITLNHHETRYLGTLRRFDEVEDLLPALEKRLQRDYSPYLRSYNEIAGENYYYRKKWKLAIENFLLCLERPLPLRREKTVQELLGISYEFLGEIEKSSKIFKKLADLSGENSSYYSYAMRHLARLYTKLGKLTEAIQIYKEEFSKFNIDKLSKPETISIKELVFDYILCLFELNDIENAESLHETMKRLDDGDLHQQKYITVRIKIGEGLIYSMGRRARDKIQAQNIFEELSEVDNLDESALRIILTNYCDLLLLELEQFGEEEVFKQVSEVVDKIYNHGTDQQSFILIIEALLLKAKLQAIQTNFDDAQKFYDQAGDIASDLENQSLINRVEDTISHFHTNLSRMQEVANKGGSLHEMIKMNEIKNYFKLARNIIDAQDD